MTLKNNNIQLKTGVSGILRVKNDATFLNACIDSCIDALDELIIVYNDCSDNSPEIIEAKRSEYPDKIKVYEYPYKILGVDLNDQEYEKAKLLPETSPNLLCSYYNFALSKVNYKYALKIDADQIYFTEELNKWCNLCRETSNRKFKLRYISGILFQLYLSLYRFVSIKMGYVSPILPQWIIDIFYPSYIEFAKYLFKKGKVCLSMSGINIIIDQEKYYVSMGLKNNIINILPPFNGEGDHVIFKVSSDTYYKKFDMPYYNSLRSSNHSIIEEFVHPYKVMYIGFFWFHINAMRPNIKERVLTVRRKIPNTFLILSQFVQLKYNEILHLCDNEMFSLYQRILFSFVYKANYKKIRIKLIKHGRKINI